MLDLKDITLLGIDCVDLDRLKLVADISCRDISFGAVKLLSSIPDDDSRVVPIRPINSSKEYSDFCIKEMHRYVDTKYVLVFQYDGFVLNPDAWSDVFFAYDYIGAPWYHLGDLRVGNGGFSLRSKRLLVWLAEHYNVPHVRLHPEDVFISRFARPFLEKEGMVFAPEDVATKFAWEGSEHSVVWDGQFGFHGITYTDISNWLSQHAEYQKQLSYPLDDYVTLMKKYPVYTGHVHTFRFGKHDLENYKRLSEGVKQYEIRVTKEKYHDWSHVREGDTIIGKRSGVSFAMFPIPAFERTVSRLERFSGLHELKSKYPDLSITPPFDLIPRRMRFLVRYMPTMFLPKHEEYTVFWF